MTFCWYFVLVASQFIAMERLRDSGGLLSVLSHFHGNCHDASPNTKSTTGFIWVMENLESHGISYFNFQGNGKLWKSNMLSENKRQNDKKFKKVQTSQKQTLTSVEKDTSTHFMHYNAGKYVK